VKKRGINDKAIAVTKTPKKMSDKHRYAQRSMKKFSWDISTRTGGRSSKAGVERGGKKVNRTHLTFLHAPSLVGAGKGGLNSRGEELMRGNGKLDFHILAKCPRRPGGGKTRKTARKFLATDADQLEGRSSRWSRLSFS